jgi:hypothetical protein
MVRISQGAPRRVVQSQDGRTLTDAEIDKLAEYAIRLVYYCRNSGIAKRFEDVEEFCAATERLLGYPVPSIPQESPDYGLGPDATDAHPEDRCHRCGGQNVPSWSVDSDRWNMGTADTELREAILCPGCFVVLHEEMTGMRTSWKLVPDPMTSFRHLEFFDAKDNFPDAQLLIERETDR